MAKKATKEKKPKVTTETAPIIVIAAGGKEDCPRGYVWNGIKCVADVG